MEKKSTDFESSLKKLEEIVTKLESGNENLEKSIELYQKGIDISESCAKILKNAKQKISTCEK